jgi:hypothetical protein
VIVLGAVLALVVYVRLRFAAVPLERDEGEYAYAGQLILKGIPPYTLVYNMKFPGTYYAYAALMAVFGQTAWGIRVGLLVVHLATVGLVYALGRRLAGAVAGGIGAAIFALLALDRWSMGLFAHATHFVLLPAVAGLLVLNVAMRSGRAWQFVAAGVLAGLAVVMKQQALPLAILAVGLAAWSGVRTERAGIASWWQRGLWTAGGGAAAFALLLVVLAVEGVLGRFWFWTFQYAAAYVSELPLSVGASVFAMAWAYVTRATGWLWYAGLAGLALLLLTRYSGRGEGKTFVIGWFVASVAAVLPGFFFRPHYFILLMPAAGILAGVAFTSIEAVLSGSMKATSARLAALLAAGIFLAVYVQRDSHDLFEMNDTELVRSIYSDNPFLEAPEIGRYLAAHTTPGDSIAVLGSEPEILFYADRASATGYIYMYPLMEPQPYAARMRQELRQEIETAQPAYLVLSGIPGSWGARPDSDMSIVEWANQLATTCYDMVGLAEVDPRQGARVRWDADLAGYRPTNDSRLSVFRRKSTAPCRVPGLP